MCRNTHTKIMLGIFDLRYCNHFSIPYTRVGIMELADVKLYNPRGLSIWNGTGRCSHGAYNG